MLLFPKRGCCQESLLVAPLGGNFCLVGYGFMVGYFLESYYAGEARGQAWGVRNVSMVVIIHLERTQLTGTQPE